MFFEEVAFVCLWRFTYVHHAMVSKVPHAHTYCTYVAPYLLFIIMEETSLARPQPYNYPLLLSTYITVPAISVIDQPVLKNQPLSVWDCPSQLWLAQASWKPWIVVSETHVQYSPVSLIPGFTRLASQVIQCAWYQGERSKFQRLCTMAVGIWWALVRSRWFGERHPTISIAKLSSIKTMWDPECNWCTSKL